jgi:cation diffusion facilitator family transporter
VIEGLFRTPRSYALLSIAAAVATAVIKLAAWRATGSVGLLSDALESLVNLAAAAMAYWALSLAAKPADASHPYGHSKAEYFSSGVESALILVAAVAIFQAALSRLEQPETLAALGTGVALSLVATAINGLTAWTLLHASRRFDSIGLRADAHHLLTDVWTSIGVVLALGLVQLTGLTILDPLIAIGVALNIVWTGWGLLRETLSGLLDRSLPAPEQDQLEAVLNRHRQGGLAFHAVRGRVAGSKRFVSLHVLVPGCWTVAHGHAICDGLEQEIAATLPRTHVITHLEPIEDPASWDDEAFVWDRSSEAASGR